jgi:hypothetical protein
MESEDLFSIYPLPFDEPSQTISFVNFPGEIRNQIYRECFEAATIPRRRFRRFSRNYRFGIFKQDWPSTRFFCPQSHLSVLFQRCAKLFVLNKQIFHESHSLFFGHFFPRICFTFVLEDHKTDLSISQLQNHVPSWAWENMNGMAWVKRRRMLPINEPDLFYHILNSMAIEGGYRDRVELKNASVFRDLPHVRLGFPLLCLAILMRNDGFKCKVSWDQQDNGFMFVAGNLGGISCLQCIVRLVQKP